MGEPIDRASLVARIANAWEQLAAPSGELGRLLPHVDPGEDGRILALRLRAALLDELVRPVDEALAGRDQPTDVEPKAVSMTIVINGAMRGPIPAHQLQEFIHALDQLLFTLFPDFLPGHPASTVIVSDLRDDWIRRGPAANGETPTEGV